MRIRFTFIMIFMISLASARTCRVAAESNSTFLNHKKHKRHRRHRYAVKRVSRRFAYHGKSASLYDCMYIEAGYSKLDFKGKYFDGGTFNVGLQAGGDHVTFGISTGFDFALNPASIKNALLPSPAAFNNYLYLNEALNFGFPIGNRFKMEVPLKTNLVLGKHAYTEIPAYINQYHFDQAATGLNFMMRLNSNVSNCNVWLGVGANYRLAYSLSDIKPTIGRNEDYSGLSYFTYLRFDFQ